VNNSNPASPKLTTLKRESSIIKTGVPSLSSLFLKDASGTPTNGTLPEIVFGDEIGNIVENIDIQLVKGNGRSLIELVLGFFKFLNDFCVFVSALTRQSLTWDTSR
jgi:hypothetical protein